MEHRIATLFFCSLLFFQCGSTASVPQGCGNNISHQTACNPTGVKITNLTGVLVREWGNARFIEPLEANSIWSDCDRDTIRFNVNDLGISRLVLFSSENSYCGVRVHFSDLNKSPVDGTINGDLDQFSLIDAGYLKFIAVR